MRPSDQERLERIREVTDNGLRYFATAHLKTDADEEHTIAERDLLMAYMMQLANVMALLEGEELDDRSVLGTRRELVDRYLLAARNDPWIPPEHGTLG